MHKLHVSVTQNWSNDRSTELVSKKLYRAGGRPGSQPSKLQKQNLKPYLNLIQFLNKYYKYKICFVNTWVAQYMYIAGLKSMEKYGAYINNQLKNKNINTKSKNLSFEICECVCSSFLSINSTPKLTHTKILQGVI